MISPNCSDGAKTDNEKLAVHYCSGMPLVSVLTEPERPIAIIAATTNWREFPTLCGELLTEVHKGVRWQGTGHKGRNVMLYLDDVPHVEIGVELDQPAGITGRVMRSALPSGMVATMRHHGPHERLGATHDAIRAFCARHSLPLAGPRWEVYGHCLGEPARLETDVYYLLG